MVHMLESLLVKVILENMNGLIKHKMGQSNLVFQLQVLRVQKKCFSQKTFISMKHKFNKIFIEKLMETSNLENRKKETIIGNLTQMSTFLVMEKREYWMELQKLFNQRDMEAISQRQL